MNGPRSPSYTEQSPRAGHAFEFVFAAVFKVYAGAGHEVGEGAGHEHLVRPGEGGYALADDDADPGHIVAAYLYLAGVEPRPQLQSESDDRIADGTGTPNRSSRCVEGGEDTVTCGLDLPASVPLEVSSHDRVVRVQERAPRLITDLAGALGRA